MLGYLTLFLLLFKATLNCINNKDSTYTANGDLNVILINGHQFRHAMWLSLLVPAPWFKPDDMLFLNSITITQICI